MSLQHQRSMILIRPKFPVPPPDSSAIRRMQNRWEAETQQREAAAAKAQVPKPPSAGRGRDRWAASSDAQTPPADTSRSTVAPANQQQPGTEDLSAT